eukprot:c6052_g1_i1.p1 GENE.c6052_g1_i1~~c6052_g1_i1.p1  ORF type:complete len:212 (+),score=43.02 c6052_g1_i1:45-638(+)
MSEVPYHRIDMQPQGFCCADDDAHYTNMDVLNRSLLSPEPKRSIHPRVWASVVAISCIVVICLSLNHHEPAHISETSMLGLSAVPSQPFTEDNLDSDREEQDQASPIESTHPPSTSAINFSKQLDETLDESLLGLMEALVHTQVPFVSAAKFVETLNAQVLEGAQTGDLNNEELDLYVDRVVDAVSSVTDELNRVDQ